MTAKRERVFGGKITTPITLFGETESLPAPNTIEICCIQLPVQQPRRYFDPQKMEQLVLSVKEHGILEPLLVRTLGKPNVYELVAGERRYRAAKEAGLTDVPAVVRDLTDEQAVQLALIENLQREDLNPVEETEGVLQLLALKLEIAINEVPKLLYRMQNEVKGRSTHNVMGSSETETVQAVFASLTTMTWESFVNNRLPLLKLPDDVLEALRQGRIAYTKAQVIARVKDEQQRDELLEKAIIQNLSLNEIKVWVTEVKPDAKSDMTPERVLVSRMTEITKRLKKSKAWNERKKHERITKLLDELERLTEEA